jgi:RND family efflux transporter MFP subunit
VLLGASLSAPAASQDRVATAPATKAAMTVTTVKPASSQLPLRLTANGNIAAWQEASVSVEVGGLRLTEIHAAVGDQVQRGQLLASFNSESVAADLAQSAAQVAEAQAQAAEATANADRARNVQASGIFSGQQITQLLTAELGALARLESARATLAVQQLRMRNTRLLAPDSGVISARSATLGAVVAGGTELFRLIRQGRLEWRAEVTSAELGLVKPGTAVTLTAASGDKVVGKVRMTGPTVDPQTRSALVYVDLGATSGNSAVRPGMFARGDFELGNSVALTLPQQAVVVRDGFSYVFKVAPDQHVSRQKVSVGRRIGELVEITQGINADNTIAATGAGFLNDGDLVRVNNAPAK